MADAGRVFFDGECPGGWHAAVGGGVWMSLIDRAFRFNLNVGAAAPRRRADD